MRRDGAPFLTVKLEKSHYLIGREPGCDILLKGIGVPMRVGEIFLCDGNYAFRNFAGYSVKINGMPMGEEARKVMPGDEITFCNLAVTVGEGSGADGRLRAH